MEMEINRIVAKASAKTKKSAIERMTFDDHVDDADVKPKRPLELRPWMPGIRRRQPPRPDARRD